MLGVSMKPYLSGQSKIIRTDKDYIGWEMFGNRALRQGKWKILWITGPNGDDRWELYDLEKDPGESKDLSKQYPEKFKEMLLLWDDYVKRNGVVIPIPKKGN
jgi:arylsulfatase